MAAINEATARAHSPLTLFSFSILFVMFFRSEYIFKFDDKFEMHDDAEVLKRMGLLFGKL